MSSWHELIVASGLPGAEAQLLAARASGRQRSWILAHDTDTASPEAEQTALAWFGRRRAGEPVAYILGEREFYSLTLTVTPAVLIPRPETELLVELALGQLCATSGTRASRMLDIGTGSGAIAIAVSQARPGAEVWASDISPAALNVARDNARRHGADIRFIQSDGLEQLAGERFDVIVSNPPYVAETDPHLLTGDLRFEPRIALASGPDGLDLIRRLAADARRHLRDGGCLLFEHGYDQGSACVALLNALGYVDVSDHVDLSGHARICTGRIKVVPCTGRVAGR